MLELTYSMKMAWRFFFPVKRIRLNQNENDKCHLWQIFAKENCVHPKECIESAHTHTYGNYDHLPCQKRRKENENDIITQFPDDKSLQISQCYWYWSFSMSIGMDWM